MAPQRRAYRLLRSRPPRPWAGNTHSSPTIRVTPVPCTAACAISTGSTACAAGSAHRSSAGLDAGYFASTICRVLEQRNIDGGSAGGAPNQVKGGSPSGISVQAGSVRRRHPTRRTQMERGRDRSGSREYASSPARCRLPLAGAAPTASTRGSPAACSRIGGCPAGRRKQGKRRCDARRRWGGAFDAGALRGHRCARARTGPRAATAGRCPPAHEEHGLVVAPFTACYDRPVSHRRLPELGPW